MARFSPKDRFPPRLDLDLWMKTLPQPWSAAMEATMFTGWIYDHLKPHAAALKVAHPLMLRALQPTSFDNRRLKLVVRLSLGQSLASTV